MKKTREYCDGCGRDVTAGVTETRGGSLERDNRVSIVVHRRAARQIFKHFVPRFLGWTDEDWGWTTICADCLQAIGHTVRGDGVYLDNDAAHALRSLLEGLSKMSHERQAGELRIPYYFHELAGRVRRELPKARAA